MRKFQVGDRVKIIKNTSSSVNKINSEGFISCIDEIKDECRVVVEGISDDNLGNWSYFFDLELIEREKPKTSELEKILELVEEFESHLIQEETIGVWSNETDQIAEIKYLLQKEIVKFYKK